MPFNVVIDHSMFAVFFALVEFALLSFLDIYIRRYIEWEQRTRRRAAKAHCIVKIPRIPRSKRMCLQLRLFLYCSLENIGKTFDRWLLPDVGV